MERVERMIETVKTGLSEGWREEDLLSFLRNHLGTDSAADVELVERLGDLPDVRVGGALQKILPLSKGKAVRKGIRRSLYRIKSRGVHLPEEIPQAQRSALRPWVEQPPMGLAGCIDGHGNRLLVLPLPHLATGYTVMTGLVSDTQGWVSFSRGNFSKKMCTKLLREYEETAPFPLVEIEPAYALHLFEEAHQLSLRQGRSLPPEYLQLRASTERFRKTYERPLIYAVLEPDRGPEAEWLLERSGQLLRMDLFGDWGLEEGEAKPYVEAVQEVYASRLVMTEGQKRARVEEIYRQGLFELFPEPRRLLYKRRLEEMAYILHKLERHEEARMALVAAMDLERPFNLLKPNAFLLNLVARSILSRIVEKEEKKKEEPSLIIRL